MFSYAGLNIFWRYFVVVSDSNIISTIKEALSHKKIYIADGHHRYETALAYSEYRKKQDGDTSQSQQDYDYALMALVSFSDPGFLLLVK